MSVKVREIRRPDLNSFQNYFTLKEGNLYYYAHSNCGKFLLVELD